MHQKFRCARAFNTPPARVLKQCVETMGVVRESKGKLGSKKLSNAHDTVSKKHASAVKKGPAKHGKPLKAKDEVTQNPTKKKIKSVRIHEVPNVVQFPSNKAPASLKTITKKQKGDAVEKVSEIEDGDDEDANNDAELLSGFPDSISDEEDEEDDAMTKQAGLTLEEVANLPSSRGNASVTERLEKAKKKKNHKEHKPSEAGDGDKDDTKTGVVYVGRLPHGFFEDQLRAYFSQFGDINRLRLSRNKKTGRSKHYGFLEFDSPDVAEIVVDTMNNYLLDGHMLQLSMIPPEKVDPNLWVGANRKFRTAPVDRMERARRSRSRTLEERAKVNQRLLQRQKKRRAALERAGIEYDFSGYEL